MTWRREVEKYNGLKKEDDTDRAKWENKVQVLSKKET